MNAMLNIQVRVAAQQANAALNQVKGGVNGVTAAAARSAGPMAAFNKNMNPAGLIKFGKNLQWTGQQLMYNITLPFALAAGAATKWALDNERAMTQVRKVYGDLAMSTKTVKEETDALSESFKLLSNRFGENQAEVIDIGAAWAAAGSSGVGLAKSVRTTLEAMTIGDMGAEEAFEALITVQSLYRLNSDELRRSLAILNIVENETAVRFSGLIDVLARAGGAARTAGIDIRHLSAMAAALVPHASTASQAGNALRTIISRITAPTKDAIQMFQRMGIEIDDLSWTNANGVQKVEMLAEAFGNLTQGQKNVVAATVGSRWQVSRFAVLMEDIASRTGNYNKALVASGDEVQNLATYQKELNAVLASNPKRLDIMIQTLKNALTDAFLPLMPVILAMVNRFTRMAEAFAGLDEGTKQLVILGLAAVALLGPLLKVISMFSILFGLVGRVGQAIWWVASTAIPFLITNLGHLLAWAGRVLLGGIVDKIAIGLYNLTGVIATAFGALAAALGIPLWAAVAIVAAVVAAIVILLNKDMREGVWNAIEAVGRGIWALPRIFMDALSALARVVAAIITEIIDMLSYLNPFARHSPSLVDNVRAGVDVIIDEYGRLVAVTASLDKAAEAHKRFAQATAGGRAQLRGQERDEQRSVILQFSPGAGAALSGMWAEIDRLTASLPGLQAQIDQQDAAVRDWTAALDRANISLERERDLLEVLRDRASDASRELQEAKEVLNDLANTNITGMRASEDAIFANEMAQKRLRLEIMRLEDQAGGSLDELKSKMAALRGEQEMLFGQKEELRLAGAGSEILRTYEDQIDAIKEQERATWELSKPLQDAEKQLEELRRAGERLDLEHSIRFDEQLRQIDQMVNGLNELPFDQIISRLGEQQVKVKELEEAQKAANDAVEAQEEVLRRSEKIRDAIADQLDIEKEKARALKDSYSDIEDQIRAMESAINDFAATASAALADAERAAKSQKDTRSTAETLFDAGGEYEIPGGDSLIGREGMLADIEAFNEELQRELEKLGQDLGTIDFMAPVKEAWDQFWDFMTDFSPFIDAWNGMWDFVGRSGGEALFGALQRNLSLSGLSNIWGEIQNAAITAFTAIGEGLQMVWDTVIFPVLNTIWSWLSVVLIPIWTALSDAVAWAWNEVIHPVIEEAWDIIEPIFDAVVGFIKGYLIPIFELFSAIVQIVFVVFGRVIKAAWENVVLPVFRAVWGWVDENLTDVFESFGTVIDTVWEGIKDAIEVAWEAIKIVFNGIKWALENVVGPVFRWLEDNVIQPVWSGITSIVDTAWTNLKANFTAVKDFLEKTLGPVFTWLKDNIISPVFNGIVSIIRTTFNTAMSIIEKGINFFISAFNTLARGVNKVADFLNIKVSVSYMDPVKMPRLMAEGGIVPETGPGGGMFNKARAIVGEGNPMYPEFVIPTDPRYRGKALDLWRSAGQRLAHTDEVGGWGPIGTAIEAGKKAVGGLVGAARRGAAKAVFAPLSAAADLLIKQIPFKIARETAKSIKDEFYNWVTGADSNLPEAGVAGDKPIPGAAHWSSITRWLRNNSDVPHRITSTFRLGDPGRHGRNLAVDLAGPQPGWNTPQLRAINEALLPIAGTLHELIYSGPGGQSFKRGKPHAYSASVRADHHDHVHAALRAGGLIARHQPGGSLIRVGEGRHDEAVQVLPIRHGQDDGGRVLNFYGDLEFPNIRSGDDAEAFVRNLEALVD